MRTYNIAVVGATGAVGEEIFSVLDEVKFPVKELHAFASAKSVGEELEFQDRRIKVKLLDENSFEDNEIDIAFFCAGSSVSSHFAPYAVESGALVIDNTSYFRMNKDIPLVVPEVNPHDIVLAQNKGIISNPNCSTIQMLQVLKPLDDVYNIKRVDVATYQAVSGAGKIGMQELVQQMQDFFAFKLDESKNDVFPQTIALNLFPHIDVFMDNAYTKEEMKMLKESQKILHKNIELSATCVRVPVLRSHSEAITIEFEKDVDAEQAKEILKAAPNLVLLDDIENKLYPTPLLASNKNETFVGRVRKDLFRNNILHLWCVADQIRVGAATNAVRIAIKYIEMQEE